MRDYLVFMSIAMPIALLVLFILIGADMRKTSCIENGGEYIEGAFHKYNKCVFPKEETK